MSPFQGFPEGKMNLTPVPEDFFRLALPEIDHLDELKLMLYIFWRLSKMEGKFRYLRHTNLVRDEPLLQIFNVAADQFKATLDGALERAIRHGLLLKANLKVNNGEEVLYFLNTPNGRAALQAIASGQWKACDSNVEPLEWWVERPNIFRLYEENFGPLTPLLADALGEAEDTYPREWIEEAFRIAVEKNKRNWRYVSAILERWKRDGYHARKEKPQDQRSAEESRRRFVEGEFSEFVEH